MTDYTIGQVFNKVYPPEAAEWCNENCACITKQADGSYIIVDCSLSEEEQKQALIKSQITELEALQTPRRIRDAALTADGKTWLENIEKQIAELRKEIGATS